jgi:menaquinone-dependent protoporphyrinogen oxidase
MTRILVAYGSTRGSTAQLAHWIADDLREVGVDADARPAGEVRDVTGYDAVVLGGALYMGRWHREARRFARHYATALVGRPVWLFSSGPLDHTAEEPALPPVKGVVKATRQLDARGHVTFGGALAPDARGFPASAMAKKLSGDYRNRDHVRTWARSVAAAVGVQV